MKPAIAPQIITMPALREEEAVALRAGAALLQEVLTWPKPGLVSHVDNGSHHDMNVDAFIKSAHAITPFFGMLFFAGSRNASLTELRRIGIAAEQAMLFATGGVNTHRGAIWGLGLLSAATGWRARHGVSASCGEIVRTVWGAEIHATPSNAGSHGDHARTRYGAGGARKEAADGFPIIHRIGLPALRQARTLRQDDEEAARVQCCMTLIATMEDTNLLHRGGPEGLIFAKKEAALFLKNGGIAKKEWKTRSATIHRRFIERNLSPGGSADALAMCLFLDGSAA